MMCIEGGQSQVEEDPETIVEEDKIEPNSEVNSEAEAEEKHLEQHLDKVCYSKTGSIMNFRPVAHKSSMTGPVAHDLEVKEKEVKMTKPKVY